MICQLIGIDGTSAHRFAQRLKFQARLVVHAKFPELGAANKAWILCQSAGSRKIGFRRQIECDANPCFRFLAFLLKVWIPIYIDRRLKRSAPQEKIARTVTVIPCRVGSLSLLPGILCR